MTTQFDNIHVSATITATSKANDKYKKDIPTLKFYLKLANEDQAKALKNFGLTEYSSKEDNETFFIVKASRKIAVYTGTGTDDFETISGAVADTRYNYYTVNPVKINIMKIVNEDGTFYRLQALLLDSMSDLLEIVPTNPFA